MSSAFVCEAIAIEAARRGLLDAANPTVAVVSPEVAHVAVDLARQGAALASAPECVAARDRARLLLQRAGTAVLVVLCLRGHFVLLAARRVAATGASLHVRLFDSLRSHYGEERDAAVLLLCETLLGAKLERAPAPECCGDYQGPSSNDCGVYAIHHAMIVLTQWLPAAFARQPFGRDLIAECKAEPRVRVALRQWCHDNGYGLQRDAAELQQRRDAEDPMLQRAVAASVVTLHTETAARLALAEPQRCPPATDTQQPPQPPQQHEQRPVRNFAAYFARQVRIDPDFGKGAVSAAPRARCADDSEPVPACFHPPRPAAPVTARDVEPPPAPCAPLPTASGPALHTAAVPTTEPMACPLLLAGSTPPAAMAATAPMTTTATTTTTKKKMRRRRRSAKANPLKHGRTATKAAAARLRAALVHHAVPRMLRLTAPRRLAPAEQQRGPAAAAICAATRPTPTPVRGRFACVAKLGRRFCGTRAPPPATSTSSAARSSAAASAATPTPTPAAPPPTPTPTAPPTPTPAAALTPTSAAALTPTSAARRTRRSTADAQVDAQGVPAGKRPCAADPPVRYRAAAHDETGAPQRVRLAPAPNDARKEKESRSGARPAKPTDSTTHHRTPKACVDDESKAPTEAVPLARCTPRPSAARNKHTPTPPTPPSSPPDKTHTRGEAAPTPHDAKRKTTNPKPQTTKHTPHTNTPNASAPTGRRRPRTDE